MNAVQSFLLLTDSLNNELCKDTLTSAYVSDSPNVSLVVFRIE